MPSLLVVVAVAVARVAVELDTILLQIEHPECEFEKVDLILHGNKWVSFLPPSM